MSKHKNVKQNIISITYTLHIYNTNILIIGFKINNYYYYYLFIFYCYFIFFFKK